MLEALRLWRLFPSQIASNLQLHYHGRHIREWHRRDFTMSSRELLELLAELPETSTFKEASERTLRVVEYRGDDEELKGKLLLMPAIGRPPTDVEVIDEYVDWTFDRKLQARNVRELASLRADGHDYQPDLTGLIEPLEAILGARRQQAKSNLVAQAKSQIHSGLYGYEKGGESCQST